MVGIFNNTVSASPTNESIVDQIIYEDQTKEHSIDEDGIETIEITNEETLKSIESHIEKPDPNKKLRSITIKKDKSNRGNIDENDLISPYVITSLKRTGTRYGCGHQQLSGGKSTGVGDISLTATTSVTSTISGGAGVDLKVINANLGVSITNGKSISSGASYNPQKDDGAPAGVVGVIQAFDSYEFIDYDIYRFGLKWSTGTVRHVDGICFYKWY